MSLVFFLRVSRSVRTNILNIYILRSPQKTVLSFYKKYFLRKKNGESRCGFGQLVPLLKSRGARNSSSKGRNRHFLLILLTVHQHLYKAQKVTFQGLAYQGRQGRNFLKLYFIHGVKCNMTHSQMLGKVEYGLPAKS